MDFKGKIIHILGDSITEGCGASTPEQNFVSIFSDISEAAVVRNYGVGGTRLAKQITPSENPQYDLDFLLRAKQMEPDADVIVIFGGTNDYGHGDAPFGTLSDRTQDTFCGAVHCLLSYLKEQYPTKQIVLMTPLHRTNETNPRFDGKVLSDFVDAEIAIARMYSVPVLDLYAMSGICPDIPAIKEAYAPDGLHPNDAGHSLIAERLYYFLKNY